MPRPSLMAPPLSCNDFKVDKKGVLRQTLHTGATIPLVGLGTWPGGEKYGRSSQQEVQDAVETAIRAGYRHIDTAANYNTEKSVGAAVAKLSKEGIVTREELFITTKLANTDHEPEAVGRAVRQSLDNLGMAYVDLYLMHWPWTPNRGPVLTPSIKETWQAMEALVDAGLAKHIGVSNFSIKKLEDLLSYARIKPAVNQVEVHPYFRSDDLIRYCKSKGIHVSAYSPVGSQWSGVPRLVEDATVKKVAEQLGKTPGQVVLRWGIQHGTDVLPKSATPSRIKENIDLSSWEIPAELFAELSSIEPQMRLIEAAGPEDRAWYDNMFHPDGPYKVSADLWDE